MKINSFSLRLVDEMPVELEPGVLFVSKRFKVAGHLCACGCGNKVIVPLGEPGFTFSENGGRPTLYPSIGSWQLPCKSHYFITDGKVDWCEAWSPRQIEEGRREEQERLKEYYRQPTEKNHSLIHRIWKWILGN